VALDFSSVLDLDGLLDRLINKDIPKVNFLLSQVGLWSKAFSFKFEGKPFFGAGDVAESDAFISIGLSRAEGHSNGNLAVGPDLSNQGFNFEDVILEQKEIVFNSLPDRLILSSKSKFSTLFLALSQLTRVSFFL
jgi:hypothetical protein